MPQTLTPPAKPAVKPSTGLEFKVAQMDDLSKFRELAEWGRKELMLAEQEMPGLMSCREEYAKQQPLKGLKIVGSLHMTIQTAVLIETLVAARRRCALVFVQHLQHAGSRRRGGGRRPAGNRGTVESPKGVPVFAWKGETLEEYWWCTERAIDFGNGTGPDQIVDDGGDVTLLIHKGTEFEAAGKVPEPRDH